MQQLSFARYRLERHNARLWRGNRLIPLTSKAFAVLQYLVEQAGQVVTKAELFAALWPGTAVSDDALTVCIVELRKALRDNAKAPRYIETVHRRGYRFLPAVTSYPAQHSQVRVPSANTPHVALSAQHSLVVGRESELARLHGWFDKAMSRERQLVFVTGEPGIGKTTLVDAFLRQVTAQDVWIGRGQCIEQYGAGEAYMPVLEALGRLCREPGGERLIALLHQYAPAWLVQMPALLNGADLEALQRKTASVTRERMLREMAEALEAITAERPLVLWLEDLHWSDASTLELLALLARRQEPARVLVLGTYRPVEVIVREHPLRTVTQELQLHGLCAELPLGLLSEKQVGEYLTARFLVSAPALTGDTQGEGLSPAAVHDLARLIHRRTDGNPLFMVAAVEDLLRQQVLTQDSGHWALHGALATVESKVPGTVQQLIEQHIERLSPEDQRVLEVASVVGVEFSAAAVAAGTGTEVEVVEEQCVRFARQHHFLQTRGTAEWPDGTVAARYAFLHALYQEVLHTRLPAGRQQRLHQRIGERKEQAYGEGVHEIVTELAVHFEHGRHYRKAVEYRQRAGQNALRRSAHHEAVMHLTKAMALLPLLPDTPERTQRELRLQLALGTALISTEGPAAPATEHAYARARALCQHVGETPWLFPVLGGLCNFYQQRGEFQTARELAEQLLHVAHRTDDPGRFLWAHFALGASCYYLGELVLAQRHLEQSLGFYELRQHRPPGFVFDPKVICLSVLAYVLWLLGYPDQAFRRNHEALTLAQELGHVHSLATALSYRAGMHVMRSEWQHTQEWGEDARALSAERGFPHLLALATFHRGWARAKQGRREEGITQMRQGMAALAAAKAEPRRSWILVVLAEAYGEVGAIEEGLNVLAEAFATVDHAGERYYEAELHRLKGELTLQQENQKAKISNTQYPTPSTEADAEACFRKAIDIARTQEAKMWELRATVSLARLWQQQGEQHEAHKILSEIYHWFTEGFETKDLQEAKALLEQLA